MATTCPVCGSDSFSKKTVKNKIPVPYGNDAIFEEEVLTCNICGVDGDFDNTNDAIIEQALITAQKESAEKMLKDLAEHGTTMAYFERAMGLPARTLNRWKNGDFSAAGLALLRTVRTFPWLLDVADQNFDQRYATQRMVREAGDVIGPVLDKHLISKTISISQNGDVATVGFSFSNTPLETRPIVQPIEARGAA